jgi:hypothetical protein
MEPEFQNASRVDRRVTQLYDIQERLGKGVSERTTTTSHPIDTHTLVRNPLLHTHTHTLSFSFSYRGPHSCVFVCGCVGVNRPMASSGRPAIARRRRCDQTSARS